MNSNSFSSQRQMQSHHELMIQSQANRFKGLDPTTSQDHDPIKQNGPFIHDGCFWNVGLSFNIKQKRQQEHFEQLNLEFQGEIYKKHLKVIKLCLKKYYQIFDIGGYSQEESYGTANEAMENMFTRPRNWKKACQFFVKSLSQEEFSKEQIKELASKLQSNPLLLNVFQVLGQPVPARLRQKFYLYLFYGLCLTQQLNQFNVLDRQSNLQIVAKKIQELTDQIRVYEDQKGFKEFLQIIIYTAAIAGLGRAQNLFYQSLQRQFSNQQNFQLTKFQRQLDQISKGKAKKANLVRRNTLGRSVLEENLPKKRFNSNDP